MAKSSLEQRVARLEAELAQLKSQRSPNQPSHLQSTVASPEQPWWESIVGMFADNSAFEAAVEQGRNYRQSLAKIEDAAAALDDLPSKSLETYSLLEAVIALQDDIARALDRHYTFSEIAQILVKQGIFINAAQLQHHYSSISPKQQVKSEPMFSAHVTRDKSRSRSNKSSRYAVSTH
jgi:hypothetical protein